ncbi:carboxylesterase family protein [Variovorax sp. dw_954]|uniref:carboxylesterase/lipase family protein n=1 Tax=Variovorax sp. dw_954 TaxID=2720078 RepID=UPI001BD6BBE9|nr:carboxylesterase family protein [Variovorax sp. dw_954]
MLNLARPLYAAVFAVGMAFTSVASAQDRPPQVKIDSGNLEGTLDSAGVRVFRGIPYAAPPIGDLRWREPQPAKPWTGVRSARDFGDRCQQGPFPAYKPIGGSGMSENCLFLNVWSASDSARRPVLVWIHGGGLGYGYSNQADYDGDSFVDKGLVYVSLNYRVGVLGYLAHPELTAESPNMSSGNYGALDQLAALQWIRRNIAAFGGDPDNVTIFGESAGSVSVSALTASPMAKGLFRRGIGDSGASLGSTVDTLPVRPLAWAEKRGQTFMQVAKANSLAELRAMPADRLVEVSNNGEGHMFHPGLFAPTIDGYFLKEAPEQTFARGAQNNVDLIAGWNLDEGKTFMKISRHPGTCEPVWKTAQTPSAFVAQAEKTFGKSAPEFLKMHPHATEAESIASAHYMVGDMAIAYPTWRWADLQARNDPTNVYLFFFKKATPAQWQGGAPSHGAEVPYAFDNLKQIATSWSDADYQVATQMSTYYANFAKTGNPNGTGLPRWPTYKPSDPRRMVFGERGAEVEATPVAPLQFIDRNRSAGPWCQDLM